MIKTAACNGKNVTVTNGFAKLEDDEQFYWVYSSNPSEKELQEIAKKFNIQKKLLENFRHATRSKKYSTHPLEFVFVDYYMDEENIENAKVLFLLKKNILITITSKQSNYYDYLFERVLEAVKVKKNPTIASLLYEFLEEDIEDNYEVLRKTEEIIVKMEEQAVEFKTEKIPAKEIVRLKRDLFKMSRRFWSSAKIVFLLRKGLTPIQLNEEDRNSLDDVYDTIVHQIDTITTQEEMASDILTIYMTKSSNEISRHVKKLTYITLVLTGITLVLSIPNTFATIFGIPYFPRELGEGVAWEYILAILGISTALSAGLLYRYWQKQGLKEYGE
ncbi:MAG: CorA family divalent cation transporter [Candidatus Micrarchaeota archaeon]